MAVGLAEERGILRPDWLSRGYRIPGECGTLAEESGPCFWVWLDYARFGFGLADVQALG